MIYLLISIVLSSFLFLCFKWLDNKNIPLLPAITGNYLACIIAGIIVDGGFNPGHLTLPLIIASLLLGILFFVIFYTMGYASSRIGVGVSSASSKLSLIIPVLYGALVLNEALGIWKIIALFMVLPAVLLLSYKKGESVKPASFGLLILIFIGSGVIDTSLNLINESLVGQSPASIIILIFSSALVCSLLTSSFQKDKKAIVIKNIKFGFLLGIPNYFSIHFLILGLGSGAFTSGEFYLLNNTGVIIFSLVMASVLFKEHIDRYKLFGLILAIFAIYLILFA